MTTAPALTRVRPERPAGYWERIDRIVATAPPLTDTQRAIIRTAFHQPQDRRCGSAPNPLGLPKTATAEVQSAVATNDDAPGVQPEAPSEQSAPTRASK